ncbi:unnamed protein product, partial [Amoebophrya sp. A25]
GKRIFTASFFGELRTKTARTLLEEDKVVFPPDKLVLEEQVEEDEDEKQITPESEEHAAKEKRTTTSSSKNMTSINISSHRSGPYPASSDAAVVPDAPEPDADPDAKTYRLWSLVPWYDDAVISDRLLAFIHDTDEQELYCLWKELDELGATTTASYSNCSSSDDNIDMTSEASTPTASPTTSPSSTSNSTSESIEQTVADEVGRPPRELGADEPRMQ